ncbi:hypothetical protein LIER_25212 [Lithospermum erythrorhizon]|uniref:Uncharacterized protein n=1 Tax=Lithospermum erythrorhizon TaxID=34254 RepID=A0AAV3R3T4_LITER
MAFDVCELKWLSYLFRDLQLPHIEIDCHLVRDHYKQGFVKPKHVSTKEQLADIFTKGLPTTMFFLLLSKMNFLPAASS